MLDPGGFERSTCSLWIYAHMLEWCSNKLLTTGLMSIMSVLWECLLNVLCPGSAALDAESFAICLWRKIHLNIDWMCLYQLLCSFNAANTEGSASVWGWDSAGTMPTTLKDSRRARVRTGRFDFWILISPTRLSTLVSLACLQLSPSVPLIRQAFLLYVFLNAILPIQI